MSVRARSYEKEILQSLRRITRALDINSRRLKAGYEITTPQLVCLLSLVEPDQHTATSLSKRIHLSPSTVVGIIDRLEQKGLARRERDTSDRRLVYITATAKGRRLAISVPGPLQMNLAHGLRRLSQKRRAIIAEALRTIVQLMDAPELTPGHISRQK